MHTATKFGGRGRVPTGAPQSAPTGAPSVPTQVPEPLVTHLPAGPVEGHSSLIPAFLIYGAAIRIPRNSLKT